MFKLVYGPLVKAFASLAAAAQAALTSDLLALAQQHNRAQDRSLVVPSEYLEVVVTKR